MAKDPAHKGYYADTFKYNAARIHRSRWTMPVYALSAASLAFGGYNVVYDSTSAPTHDVSDLATPAGNISYEVLSEGLDRIIEEKQDIKQAYADFRQAELHGENTERLEGVLRGRMEAQKERIENYYGNLMQNEDISETQFARLQTRLTQNQITLSEKDTTPEEREFTVDLTRVKAEAFRECQENYGVNDGHESLKNASGVAKCMVDEFWSTYDRYGTPDAQKEDALLREKLKDLVRDDATLKQLRLDAANADVAGQDTSAYQARIEYRAAEYERNLEKFYGEFMQNEDISEVDFKYIQGELVKHNMHLKDRPHFNVQSRVTINLDGLNPATFKECQIDFGVNDGASALKNANGVENCMRVQSDEKAYKKAEAGNWVLSFAVGSALFYALMVFGGSTFASRTLRQGKPRRENYKKRKPGRN